ncbi:hypothetical protein RFI_20258 [Reticulomyxa filosa]|uniref:Uncharacterized protein n=1 Tax=Reticulomyxa filosa TaxID=46433 RepID=X6MUE7_RETFI|nr:hypothetical protein RFI_20258 [Reticulomyxa filosa]|eukprot:ETO17072.1 hypothetical protein RFI_20258 [Reticulomyxa filosa]
MGPFGFIFGITSLFVCLFFCNNNICVCRVYCTKWTLKITHTQSSDGTLRIWDTNSWRCLRIIKDEFLNDTQMSAAKGDAALNRQTVLSRPHWSPDGQHLSAAFGITANGAVHCAAIVSRHKWQVFYRLIGHSQPVTVTVLFCFKFNPLLWVCDNKEPNENDNNSNSKKQPWSKSDGEKGRFYYICAVAGVDSHVSIFASNQSRPLFVVKKLFGQAIMDMSWFVTFFFFNRMYMCVSVYTKNSNRK